MSALLGMRTVINFIVKLHGFLAGEKALAQPRSLLTLHRILLVILQQKNNQLNDIHHQDPYYEERRIRILDKTDLLKSCYYSLTH